MLNKFINIPNKILSMKMVTKPIIKMVTKPTIKMITATSFVCFVKDDVKVNVTLEGDDKYTHVHTDLSKLEQNEIYKNIINRHYELFVDNYPYIKCYRKI
jgi:hypothetical protein